MSTDAQLAALGRRVAFLYARGALRLRALVIQVRYGETSPQLVARIMRDQRRRAPPRASRASRDGLTALPPLRGGLVTHVTHLADANKIRRTRQPASGRSCAWKWGPTRSKEKLTESLLIGPLLILSLTLLTTFPLFAQWAQFRGPDGNGVASSANPPLTWSEEKNVRWRTAVHGRGWSSPVILENRVWVTTATPDGKELFAVALDQQSGRIVQDIKVFQVDKPQEIHPFNSYASPTPVAEAGRVYVHFGSHGTAALDAQTGKVVWRRQDLQVDHFRGPGSSPIVFRNLLILHFDGIDQQYVIALDKTTGKTVWKTPRSIDFKDLGPDGKPVGAGDFRKAFATPQIITVGGQPLLISLGGKAIYGYEPMTGKERWRVEERRSHTASTRPVAGHGLVFYPSGWENTQVLAIRPDGSGDVTATHVVWRFTRAVPNKPSLLLADDLLFMVNDTGIASCVEAKTGALIWQSRVAGMFSASPLYAAGRVYLFDEDGKTTVIEAGRTFKVLAENLLDNGFMASAAVAGDALFLRTTMDVYRIEEAPKH